MKITITLLLGFLMGFLGGAQELQTPSYAFSHSKTAYITLKDGAEIKGSIKDIDRKKGLIEEIKIKTLDGKKRTFKPKEISFMYLPPSGLDKIGTATKFLFTASRWTDEKLNQDFLNQGYVYFENSQVRVKKKTEELLVQLLNPESSKVVKVYHDPKSGQTTGLNMYGITVTGGILKSYYFSVNNEPAYKIKKSDYDAELVAIYGNCLEEVKEEHPNLAWRDLAKHINILSDCKSGK